MKAGSNEAGSRGALRSKGQSSSSLIGSPLPLYKREENCRNCDGPFPPGHQCGDVEETEPDDGSEKGESDEPLGDFDRPPDRRLLC